MRKSATLSSSILIGLTSSVLALSTSPGAAAAELSATESPDRTAAATMTVIALAESRGFVHAAGRDGAKGGNVEFEWKNEEGES